MLKAPSMLKVVKLPASEKIEITQTDLHSSNSQPLELFNVKWTKDPFLSPKRSCKYPTYVTQAYFDATDKPR